MENESEFSRWRAEMGFNKKQVGEAGALIGLRVDAASQLHRGLRSLSVVERLAMAALLAGLKPWQPEGQNQ